MLQPSVLVIRKDYSGEQGNAVSNHSADVWPPSDGPEIAVI